MLKMRLIHGNMLKKHLVKGEMAHVPSTQSVACQQYLSTIGMVFKPVVGQNLVQFWQE